MEHYTFYIDGQLKNAVSGRSVICRSAFDGSELGEFYIGSIADVNMAINAAEVAHARGEWRNICINERIRTLSHFCQKIKENRDTLIRLEAANVGIMNEYASQSIDEAIRDFEHYLELSQDIEVPKSIGNSNRIESQVLYQPYGVCVLILPWNYPFLIGINKMIPALVAGNSVVLKPSPIAPCSWLYAASLLDEIDIPQGVVNIINVDNEGAASLVESQKVRLISFTGSNTTAESIMRSALPNGKRLIFECGGNSAHIVYKKNELQNIILPIMISFLAHSGQACVACRRLIVEELLYDQLLQELRTKLKYVSYIRTPDERTPFFPIEPIINESQMNRIDSQVQSVLNEGAELVCGGKPARCRGSGFFYEPTIISNFTKSKIANHIEIFGPVILVQKVSDIEEAISMANDTPFGLTATIWSDDNSIISKAVKELDTGSVFVNSTPFEQIVSGAPFAGRKRSGLGVEHGKYGIMEFLQVKHIALDKIWQ